MRGVRLFLITPIGQVSCRRSEMPGHPKQWLDDRRVEAAVDE
jgi:hypothetical protein